MKVATACAFAASVCAEKAEDLITQLPDFPDASTWGFQAYSGFLDVPGPINGYDSLRIHYQFHTSRNNPSADPVAIWHQGGPGSSSISIGLYGEMGAFIVGDKEHGNYVNPWAWNTLANMLYLESPAGSAGDGENSGYSQCIKGGEVVTCEWNDHTQAEAYAHTLEEFFKQFPEYAQNDFYLTGESYFGQYGPNIAHFILNDPHFSSVINLKGIAAGNACWGGTETCVACNGPSWDKIDVEHFFGRGLYSPKLKEQIDETCTFPTDYSDKTPSGDPFGCQKEIEDEACASLLKEMRRQVGPHNVYFIYDNCPNTDNFLRSTGKDMNWLTATLRSSIHNASATRKALQKMNGGFPWDCLGGADDYIARPDVHKALHLGDAVGSEFDYTCSGPASITLWPELVSKIDVLIYSGDSDACVPYLGNEIVMQTLEDQGALEETTAWAPWFDSNKAAPAGYITKYQAPGASTEVAFATIRLAGHMAPQFQPEASLVMLRNFFASGSRSKTVI